jgi:hypothetical protein
MDLGSKRDKLDYAEIIFRQMNRVSELFCEIVVPFGDGGKNYSMPAKNCFGGIVALESLIKYKLPQDVREKFLEGKIKIGLKKFNIGSDDTTGLINQAYFDLVMEYIFKSNLLPSERSSYKTGEEVNDEPVV